MAKARGQTRGVLIDAVFGTQQTVQPASAQVQPPPAQQPPTNGTATRTTDGHFTDYYPPAYQPGPQGPSPAPQATDYGPQPNPQVGPDVQVPPPGAMVPYAQPPTQAPTQRQILGINIPDWPWWVWVLILGGGYYLFVHKRGQAEE